MTPEALAPSDTFLTAIIDAAPLAVVAVFAVAVLVYFKKGRHGRSCFCGGYGCGCLGGSGLLEETQTINTLKLFWCATQTTPICSENANETCVNKGIEELWCGRRDLNPGRQRGKLMSYQTRLRPLFLPNHDLAGYRLLRLWLGRLQLWNLPC